MPYAECEYGLRVLNGHIISWNILTLWSNFNAVPYRDSQHSTAHQHIQLHLYFAIDIT
jgi:hypothetical protein